MKHEEGIEIVCGTVCAYVGCKYETKGRCYGICRFKSLIYTELAVAVF